MQILVRLEHVMTWICIKILQYFAVKKDIMLLEILVNVYSHFFLKIINFVEILGCGANCDNSCPQTKEYITGAMQYVTVNCIGQEYIAQSTGYVNAIDVVLQNGSKPIYIEIYSDKNMSSRLLARSDANSGTWAIRLDLIQRNWPHYFYFPCSMAANCK